MSNKSKYCEKAIANSTLDYIRMFEELKSHPPLNPGDIVFLHSRFNTVKQSHGVKLTFKVEETLECGLVIARKILPNGKFGPSEIINDGPWTAEVDHEYIENIIMKNENDYDPSVAMTELEKEKRRVTKYNKSISTKTEDRQLIEDFLRSLKVGDKVWYSDTLLHLKEDVFEVDGVAFIETTPATYYSQASSKLIVPVTRRYNYQGHLGSYTTKLTIDLLYKHKFFTKEEPQSVEKT